MLIMLFVAESEEGKQILISALNFCFCNINKKKAMYNPEI